MCVCVCVWRKTDNKVIQVEGEIKRGEEWVWIFLVNRTEWK